jgi:hypothetical protein
MYSTPSALSISSSAFLPVINVGIFGSVILGAVVRLNRHGL